MCCALRSRRYRCWMSGTRGRRAKSRRAAIRRSAPVVVAVVLVVVAAVGTTMFVVSFRKQMPAPPAPLLQVIQACSVSWGGEANTKLTAKYRDLKSGGEIEWKAAMEAGGTLLKHFKDDANGLEAYDKYIQCIKPSVD